MFAPGTCTRVLLPFRARSIRENRTAGSGGAVLAAKQSYENRVPPPHKQCWSGGTDRCCVRRRRVGSSSRLSVSAVPQTASPVVNFSTSFRTQRPIKVPLPIERSCATHEQCRPSGGCSTTGTTIQYRSSRVRDRRAGDIREISEAIPVHASSLISPFSLCGGDRFFSFVQRFRFPVGGPCDSFCGWSRYVCLVVFF
jgi:hypothetical protein